MTGGREDGWTGGREDGWTEGPEASFAGPSVHPSSRPPVHGRYSSLDPCVHCGFCLPACPTYLATGDESDSPRGRIVLMRALERGEIAPSDEGLIEHLDACLGCLGCEPVCPSGVGYGRGIEAAREELFAARGLSPLAAAVLAVFSREWVWRPLFTAGRWLRATGVPAWLSSGGRFGFGMAMLAATRPAKAAATAATAASAGTAARTIPGVPTDTPSESPSEAPSG
ncbi:MAG TPA: 4Fe-4S dicluster domain-containing protein, partial [Gemmatimonadales bacterium]|nr:4Fe-4S dicluster domain-containing protein [Gemmatimonadales bacterium]